MSTPKPPPSDVDLELITFIEDPYHTAARPRTWHCSLIFWRKCQHRLDYEYDHDERQLNG